jgi:tellurite resistance protein TehA-like permease
MLGTIKDVSQILANAATILVAVAAAFWFFRSRRYSRRVEFNVEFNVYESGDPEAKILQVNLMFAFTIPS